MDSTPGLKEFRCKSCNKLLLEYSGQNIVLVKRCDRNSCKKWNLIDERVATAVG